MNASYGGMPAVAIGPSDPAVPMTPTSHPGDQARSASSATRRCRPERISRIFSADCALPTADLSCIQHLCCPAFQDEERPELAPHGVVAAVEAIEQAGNGFRLECAAPFHPLGR